jgi:hypothetical protein
MLGSDCCTGPLAAVESRPAVGAAVDFRSLGRKLLWAEKGKEKGNSFLFSENIFVKNKII